MDVPGFDYAALLHRALRAMVKDLLARVAREGLPGEHHFYLTFRTGAPGVVLPEPLRRQHPEEMTIVLQHQFSDLEIGEGSFSVTLRFGGVPARLTVPFEALTAFVDPSVSFGVRLAAAERPVAGKDETRQPPKARTRGTKVVAFQRRGGSNIGTRRRRP
jgi:hypothetical protein